MKIISLKIYQRKEISALRILKILGLFGGLDISSIPKLIDEYDIKKEFIVEVNEHNIEKVIDLFKELKIDYEILPKNE